MFRNSNCLVLHVNTLLSNFCQSWSILSQKTFKVYDDVTNTTKKANIVCPDYRELCQVHMMYVTNS